MVLLTASFLVLPLVLASSKLSSRATKCEIVIVDTPSSVLGQSRTHTPPVGKHLTKNVQECMQVCCNDTACNVGLFLELAHEEDTNCLLYSCHPVDSCSPKIKKGALVFIDKDEENIFYLEPTSSSPSEFYADGYDDDVNAENAEVNAENADANAEDVDVNAENDDDNYPENPSVVTNEDVNKNSEKVNSSPILGVQPEVDTLGFPIEPSNVLSLNSTVIELTTSLKTSVNATAINISANIHELLLDIDYLATSTELKMNNTNSATSTLLEISTLQSTEVESSDFLYIQLSSTPIFKTDDNNVSLSGVNNEDVSTIILDNQFWEGSTILQSRTSDGIEETSSGHISSDVIFVNSLVAMETYSVSTLLVPSDIYKTVAGEDNADLSADSQPPQRTQTLEATSTQEFLSSTASDYQFNQNDTEFQTLNTEHQQQVEPVTAILICLLAVGCVFALAIVGVLGVRFYESYRKRHYSRLEYLNNGMYG